MQVTLLLEQTLSPVPGGTGRYSHEIAAALARTAAAGSAVRSVVGLAPRHPAGSGARCARPRTGCRCPGGC